MTTKQQELELMMEEYKRLSQEIDSTLTRRLQVLEFGLAIVGAVTGFGLSASSPTSYLVLAIVVPASCFMVVSLWLSELRRTRRASWYMYGLERRVNSLLGCRTLCWEEDIRAHKGHVLSIFRFHYYTTAGFFVLGGALAAAYGMLRWDSIPAFFRIAWPLAFLVVLSAITIYELRLLQRYDLPDSSWPTVMPNNLPMAEHLESQ